MIYSIRLKLFTILLLVTSSVVLCMYLVMSSSFDRGFLEYINKQDQQRYQEFSEALGEYYQKNGDWALLKNNWELWGSMLTTHFSPTHHNSPNKFPNLRQPSGSRQPPNSRQPQHKKTHDNMQGPPPPQRMGERGEIPPMGPESIPRPLLLDKDKTVLFGRVKDIEDLSLYPIKLQGKTVGYVGQFKRKQLSNELDLLFVEQQSQAFMLVAILMVLICIVAALPVAAHFVKPIKRLNTATQRLMSGHYKTKIDITSKDEIAQLSENFNSLAKTLNENEMARSRWIADISHELRTPLSILKGEIEAIQDGIRPSNADAINSLHAETEHLNHLVNDLYELSMSDTGALNYQKKQLKPLTILESTVNSFRSEFDSKKIALILYPPQKNITDAVIFADGARLKQLFSNLLKNALRYTDGPGELAITVSINNESLLLSFEDSPPGVSEIEITKLFDRLYRVESSRNRATGGAGLGLSICKNIVTAHVGVISAKASNLGGICISITLPLSQKTVQ